MKRITALLTLAAILYSLLCSSWAEEIDYEAVYAPVLTSVADLLSRESPEEHVTGLGEAGVYELRMGSTPEDALWKVGYVFRDLNDDSIPELILAQSDSQEESTCSGQQILAVYSCMQGSPSLLLEGWARNRYYLLPDNSFLNQGSSGAAYSCLGLYQVSPEGAELNCLDFFFTWEDEIYHNTDGTWEVPYEGNEKVDLDFQRLWEILEADAQRLDLTSFAHYQAEEPPSLLVPQWSPYAEVENCIILSSEEYSTQIVFCAYQGTVTDLQLLSLELEEVDQDGNARFKQTVLETIPTLEPEHPLVVQLSFGCSIPNFGFRYTDDTGVTRAYSLLQSGMDGSLVTSIIE